MNEFNKRNIILNALFFCNVVLYNLYKCVCQICIYICICINVCFISQIEQIMPSIYINITYLLGVVNIDYRREVCALNIDTYSSIADE